MKGITASLESLKSLDPRSRIEAPCVIQATLAPLNFINFGAFSAIYGGRLGHATVGRYCSISYGVDISSDQHPTNWLSTSMIHYVEGLHDWQHFMPNHRDDAPSAPASFKSNDGVNIGNDVWIGQGAFIKAGVSIGDGAIIAAHAVVTKDVEEYSIVAGVPAKTIRKRFPPLTIERLKALKWWNYFVPSHTKIDFSSIDLAIDQLAGLIQSGKLIKINTPSYLVSEL